MWDEKVIGRLLGLVRENYETPKMVSHYFEYGKQGIFDFEQKPLDRFLKPASRILVVGCGAGRECFPLARAGHQVTGLDISRPMLEKAEGLRRENGLPVRFVEGDVTELPENLGPFDCVVWSEWMYGFVPSRRLRIKTLKGLAATLAPEGFLLLVIGWGTDKRNPFYHNRAVTFLRTVKRRLFDSPLQEAGDELIRDSRGEFSSYVYLFQRPEEIAAEFDRAGLTLLYREDFSWVLQPQPSKISSTLK